MNTPNENVGLYWFRQDCRLTDMPALTKLANHVDSLLCVYVLDDNWFKSNRYHCCAMGTHRRSFIEQGLRDLNKQLQTIGQSLIVCTGDPLEVVLDLIREFNVTHVGCSIYSGPDEKSALQKLQLTSTNCRFFTDSATTLYNKVDLPFSLQNMPDHFSPFRRKVEKKAVVQPPIGKITALPPPPDLPVSMTAKLPTGLPDFPATTGSFIGGERYALNQLNYYLFEKEHVAQYKETRNGMLGWDFSSKLSAWLAAGHISPRLIYAELKTFEQTRVSNESTYWLFFELLWRDFFHWQLEKHGVRFFHSSGIRGVSPQTDFDTNRFARWCNGRTGYDIVDACMRELNATGFMSNRGRQLVASCFVHELGLDWRFGAAYFEQQLIDFDVASNYGNWQYLAGVGSDPRGHRQFNLDKQTQLYDPKGQFRQQWL